MKKLILLFLLLIISTPTLAQDQSQEIINKWINSPTYKWVLSDDQRVFTFNLGVVYNLGMRDGYEKILRQRDERLTLYPVFQLYTKDKRFNDLHLAYEAGAHQGYLNRNGR